ncbi:radical SAM protein [Kribbella sp. VKM Ac-2566]|uniref:radical SAM protein n=1 Tax=Kribbella sp. VKM Ac-2566 TaxID=2512218 RepID=UPI00106290B6|nr:radical SAM protein [Kribbella sp. VKM Ac-2566]TDX04018.1 radical SAM family protein [Kribbella sp. VKM Ac-2566]
MGTFIDTDPVSADLRLRMINHDRRAISLTRFPDSDQLADLSVAPNCDGFGRVHTFVEDAFEDWPVNPLPIRPAARALGLNSPISLQAQVFQNSGCNWRCWYCYVPFADLTARRGTMVAVSEMVEGTLRAHDGPHVVDLSGGQPDLTPEWPVWFLQKLDDRNAAHVYVWSDDNLSTDYLWTTLSPEERDFLGEHPRYGRACCIKGYDAESFSFNTLAAPAMFRRQFDLLRRLRETTRIDYYVYLTITTPTTVGLVQRMRAFVDGLQKIHEWLPLRCVPLKILEWGPVTPRLTPERQEALQHQIAAVDAWREEIERRFPGAKPAIEDVPR